MVSDQRGPAYPYCRFPIDFLFAWVGARFEKVYTRRPIREDIKSMPGLKKVPDMLSFMYAISTPFDSKRARQHLRDERNFIWRPYSFNCSGEGWVHEVIDMRGRSYFPEEVQEWIISLRHNVLPLRLGGSLYAQPYNPHHFARQFGLDQHFPKSSYVPWEAASTGVLAGYWLDLTQVSLSLKFFIPDSSRHGKPSSHYARWWTNSLYSYFQHGVNFLVERESCPKKKNEDLSEGPVPSPLSFELRDSSKRIEVFSAPYDYVERHHIREDSEKRPSPAPAAIETTRVTLEPVGVDNCPSLKRKRFSEVASSGSKKQNIDELTLAVIAESLPTSPQGVSHADEELSLLDPEKLPSPTPEELPSPTPKEKIALDLDPTITEYVGSTLIGQVIDMIKTSSYRDYKTVQERVRSHCRSLSSFGINISNLEMRLQRLFDGAAAIEKVMSLPTFASSARPVTAEENLDLLEKELETCLSSQNSLRQNLEQYSSEFARQENEMAELEKVLADKRAANAELSNRINMAKNCLQELDLTKEKIEGKSAEAERELIEAKEGYIATTELATLRDLISNFENYRKNI
uniref:Aminotransferase-like plant mobile domain-containing protein n=1 Tax=Ananas comosus var. bracteatus TaxID=296719 RepID=A0A6V7Q681_ANACO|nr:unnamed protein product [Ananas comosus var. bracteatus]